MALLTRVVRTVQNLRFLSTAASPSDVKASEKSIENDLLGQKDLQSEEEEFSGLMKSARFSLGRVQRLVQDRAS
jgi:hypothetical protein